MADAADQGAYVSSTEACLREAHRWQTSAPLMPRGQGGSPAPDTPQAKKIKTGQGAHQRTSQQGAAGRPGPKPSHAPHPDPIPTSAHHRHRTTAPEPGSPAKAQRPHTSLPCQDHRSGRARGHGTTNTITTPPPPPTPGPRCPNTAATRTSCITPAQPAPTGHPPHLAHHIAPHHQVHNGHTNHHHKQSPPHPPAPWYHTQQTQLQHHHHMVQHHLPPPLHELTTLGPPYTHKDLRGATHAHQQHQAYKGAPQHHKQPPRQFPMPASTLHQQPPTGYRPQPHADDQAATTHSYLDTAASQGPQEPHSMHTQQPHDPAGRPDSHPTQDPPPLPPPRAVQPSHHPPPPPPSETRPQKHHAETPANLCLPQPPPTHTTASTPSRGHQEKPHHQTPHATTKTSSPNPNHPPKITPRSTSRRTGRALCPKQPRSGTAAPPGAQRPAGATPPHLQHHPAHLGSHPGPGSRPRGGRPRLPLRRLPPGRTTRPPPARHP